MRRPLVTGTAHTRYHQLEFAENPRVTNFQGHVFNLFSSQSAHRTRETWANPRELGETRKNPGEPARIRGNPGSRGFPRFLAETISVKQNCFGKNLWSKNVFGKKVLVKKCVQSKIKFFWIENHFLSKKRCLANEKALGQMRIFLLVQNFFVQKHSFQSRNKFFVKNCWSDIFWFGIMPKNNCLVEKN